MIIYTLSKYILQLDLKKISNSSTELTNNTLKIRFKKQDDNILYISYLYEFSPSKILIIFSTSLYP